MPRQKKDAKILNIKLAISVNDKLERFLDKCLDEYFERPEEVRKPN